MSIVANTPVTHRHILSSWSPLALSWIMMAVEGPYLTALVARLDQPKINLAAFGVAFAFGLLLESPVIMLMAAAAKLVKDRVSLQTVQKISLALSIACTVAMGILTIGPFFRFWAQGLLSLPNELLDPLWWAVVLMLPWPGFIGIRRFYQGVLIASGLTKRLAVGTAIRLTTMSATAFVLFKTQPIHGAAIATASLSVGVICEALFTVRVARTTKQALKAKDPEDNSETITVKSFARFYWPLVLTTLIGMAIQPFVSFALSHSKDPIASLAVLPVIHGIVFFFRAIPLSFQEIIITMLGKSMDSKQTLKVFATYLAIILTVIMILLSCTPLAGFWFAHVAGLPDNLLNFAKWPLILNIGVPSLSLWLCWQRSLCIHYQNTKPVTLASAVEIGLVCVVMLLAIVADINLSGIIVAMFALSFARLAANLYLSAVRKRAEAIAVTF